MKFCGPIQKSITFIEAVGWVAIAFDVLLAQLKGIITSAEN